MRWLTPVMKPRVRSILAATVALLLTACSASTLNAQDLNEQISAELLDRFDVDASIDCPDDISAEDGARFECDAVDEEGNSLTVQVVQSDASGNVDWTMEAFNLPLIEETLEPEVSSSVNAEITIDCPRVLVSASAGTTLDCNVTDQAGGEGVLRITSIDGEGNVDWELNP